MDVKAFFEQFGYLFQTNDKLLAFCFLGIVVLGVVFFVEIILLLPIKSRMHRFGREIVGHTMIEYLSTVWCGWTLIVLGFILIELQVFQIKLWIIRPPYDRESLFGVIAIILGILFNVRNFLEPFLVALIEKRTQEKKSK